MRKTENIIGSIFGDLTVLTMYFKKRKSGFNVSYCNAKCVCGNVVSVPASNLKNGHTKSCGCFHKSQTAKANKTHGEACKTSEYSAWFNAKQRCIREDHPSYKRYGGRGITMCDRWLNSFENFLEDMGRRPSSLHSIDRKDNDGHYEPSNCRWATKKEQIINSTISVPVINMNTGIFFETIKEAAHSHNIKHQTLRYRVEVNKGNIVRI